MKTSALSALAFRTKPPAISWLMQMSLSRPQLISLAAGFTDHETLPVMDVRDSFQTILGSEKSGRAALQYGSTQGDPSLREFTAKYLQRLDGVVEAARAFSPERMIITNGSQQLLYLITEVLCDSGDIVLVEDPTYFVYLGILQSRGVNARGVKMTKDGLDLEELEGSLDRLKKKGRLRRLKALYLVSYFQNPTGVTTRFEKKEQVLKLLRRYERAAGHPIYLLEDAAYRELRFEGVDEKSALAIVKASDRVVYGGTYSKPFATGARVGFGMVPEPLFTAALRLKGNHDFGTSNLLQQLMHQALSSGVYEKHVEELRQRYARKAKIMWSALKQHFPASVEWWRPAGGLYFWARLPRTVKSGVRSKLFKAALDEKVLYVPGELCYADDLTRQKPDHEMRLSFGAASNEDIEKGIERLGRVLRKIM